MYHARPEFEQFHELSEEIAELQSELPTDRYTSRRIQYLYDERCRKRDHGRDAAVKHAAERLLARNVEMVCVGDLTDVLDTHWSAEVDEKTHAFWSHRQLLERLRLTFKDVGINVEEVNESESSSRVQNVGAMPCRGVATSFDAVTANWTRIVMLLGRGTYSKMRLGRWRGLPPCLLDATGTHPLMMRGVLGVERS